MGGCNNIASCAVGNCSPTATIAQVDGGFLGDSALMCNNKRKKQNKKKPELNIIDVILLTNCWSNGHLADIFTVDVNAQRVKVEGKVSDVIRFVISPLESNCCSVFSATN